MREQANEGIYGYHMSDLWPNQGAKFIAEISKQCQITANYGRRTITLGYAPRSCCVHRPATKLLKQKNKLLRKEKHHLQKVHPARLPKVYYKHRIVINFIVRYQNKLLSCRTACVCVCVSLSAFVHVIAAHHNRRHHPACHSPYNLCDGI